MNGTIIFKEVSLYIISEEVNIDPTLFKNDLRDGSVPGINISRRVRTEDLHI